MMNIFLNNKRKISTLSLLSILFQIIYPSSAFALTGGPSQSEYESFEPAGATEMVNLATGDFTYNIPLMDIDGYPLNISYHGGVNMEQEASWVGLGWTLNAGALTRGMRGLPDEFNGGNDAITEELKIKDNTTWGVQAGAGIEVIGIPLSANMGYGIRYNNYKGLGLEVDLGVSGSLSAGSIVGGGISGGLGLRLSSQDGADFSSSASIGVGISGGYGGASGSVGLGVSRSNSTNSRRGLEADIVSGSASIGGSVNGLGFSNSTGSSINLIPNTAYTPNMQFPTTFSGITGEVHSGGEVWWLNVHGYLRAFRYNQGINGSVFKRNAYGYLNLENAGYDALLDFNRDNDGTYYLECPKLPFANLTYDLFNANAQGLNELFRPYRNDLGFVYDNQVTSGGTAFDVGLEIAPGNYIGIGVNTQGITTESESGPWLNNNQAFINGASFKGINQLTNDGTNTYESSYFKAMDELNIDDATFSNSIQGNKLAALKLYPISGTNIAKLESNIKSSTGTSSYTGQKKSNRQARNTNFSFLDARMASKFGIDKKITSYKENYFDYLSGSGNLNKTSALNQQINRNFNGLNQDNHTSEITVLKEDGARYIYGLPVYNRMQKEVVFSVDNIANMPTDGLTEYGTNDNSLLNGKGIDNFYHSKTTPAYAHTYLLTSLLSKDYVDKTGDGLTNDDYGDYTKFNYSRVDSVYKWRNPSLPPTELEPKALYEPQSRADQKDDKAVYIYGEKELWYMHSIETKNYVAEFHISPRQDARGVVDENGKSDVSLNNASYKLDKIVLYSKKDLNTPIKTVNFSYSYKLCPNTPNSIINADNPNSGKLTLEKIYFTYGKSDKGVFSPYEFKYCDFNQDGMDDSGCNPSYNRTEMDRWGNYKVNGANLNNKDFSYSVQNKITADKNASVWSLSSIITPAKSKINVYYEADNYSYVQDKTPAQMLKMKSFLENEPDDNDQVNSSTYLYQNNSTFTPNNYMIIDLTELSNGGLLADNLAQANDILRNDMLPKLGKIYFKAFVQLGNGNTTQEFVPGYAGFELNRCKILTFNSTTSGSQTLYKYACIKLNEIDIEDKADYLGDNCNPISKAAWQLTRLYHPRIAYPGSEPANGGLSAAAGLLSALNEVYTFRQKNNRLRKKLYGRSVNPSLSFVRLNIPTKTKFGGGHRVKKIEIIDNWNDMVNTEATSVFGQEYTYTKTENGQEISSGVASYEPLTGGDEISLRKPIEYSVNRIAAPNDAHFFENPIGEAFFPPATIIYSKVTVKNLNYKDNSNNLIRSNLGRTEYEFYTSYDFPIYSDYDGLQAYIHKPDPNIDLFNSYIENSVHLSQGFMLRLNNMHGKLKSVLTFQEGNNNPISGVRYYYKTTSGGKELSNSIQTIDETGTISTKVMGEHIETVADFRFQNTTTYANVINTNVNISPLPTPPIPIPIPFFMWQNSTETRDFYSATLNKVVTQQGILDKVETISNYASSVTENLLWDSNTSDVILSRTSTNFRDYDYALSTPAHWVYSGMGGAYKNIGLGFKNVINTSNGVINVSNGLLKPGDEVVLQYTNSSDVLLDEYSDRLWVIADNTNNGNLILMNRTGRICNTSGVSNSLDLFSNPPANTQNFVLKVIRSGNRNILEGTAQNITFSENPISGYALVLNNNVLDASATEYSEQSNGLYYSRSYILSLDPKHSGNLTSPPSVTQVVEEMCPVDKRNINNNILNTNPYVENFYGNWLPIRSYSYLEDRKDRNASDAMDISKDGTFNNFKPFFSFFGNSWKEIYNKNRTTDYNINEPFNKWILNSELALVSPNGNMLQAKDGINRASASLYGFNHTFKTASASNAKYREIGYDSFEDYDYTQCNEDHFSFVNYKANIVNNIAHTGRKSMRIDPGKIIQLIKFVDSPDYESGYGRNNYYRINTNELLSTSNPTIIPISQNQTSLTNINNFFSKHIIPEFSPESKLLVDKKYNLSLWVKESNQNAKGTYNNVFAQILLNGSLISSLVHKSAIINGWQKLDYHFNIPANTDINVLDFRILNSSTSIAYFDDIRVQPFNSDMNSYVYDPQSLRLWAELDDRNFATFYEYDNEGILVRVKKETERGIYTVKESRQGFKKQ